MSDLVILARLANASRRLSIALYAAHTSTLREATMFDALDKLLDEAEAAAEGLVNVVKGKVSAMEERVAALVGKIKAAHPVAAEAKPSETEAQTITHDDVGTVIVDQLADHTAA